MAAVPLPLSGVLARTLIATALLGEALLPLPAAAAADRSRVDAPAVRRTPGTAAPVSAPAASPATGGDRPVAHLARADAEAELAAVREALLELARQSRTQVRSLAWIDADGRLHESSRFDSEVAVRGVRVLGYARGAPGDASVLQARLALDPPAPAATPVSSPAERTTAALARRLDHARLDAVPTGAAPGEPEPDPVAAPARCSADPAAVDAARATWRNAWRWDHRITHGRASEAGGGATPERDALRGLALAVQADVGERARQDGLPLLADAAPPSASRYQRLVLGASDTPSSAVLRLALDLLPPAHAFGASRLQARWTLERADGRPLWQAVQVWPWAGLQVDTAGSRSAAAQQAALTGWIAEQWPRLVQRWRCEPVVWQVSRSGSDRLQVQAAAASGLRPGDRLLLADPTLLPRHALEARALDSLAVAEVVSVQGGRVEARAIAGLPLPGDGPWTAWPY